MFGSYAYGEPTRDSDVDILIIMPFEGKSIYKSVEISSAFDYDFPLDLLVRRPEDIEWRYRDGDPIVKPALDKGIVLYEKTDRAVA